MNHRIRGMVAALAALAAIVVPVAAHHSFSAEYDRNKPITLTGVVTKVEWMNPHVYFFVDVEDEPGEIINWAFEMGPPRLLENGGWRRNMLEIGVEVTVEGTLAKDGSPQVNARTVTLTETGRQLGAASSEGQGKGKGK